MSEQTKQKSDLNVNHPKRPFPVKLLAYAFGFWSLLGWLRLIRAVMERGLVLEVLSSGIYIYLVTAGLIWGAAALPVIWGLMRRCSWAKPLTWIIAVLFPAVYWFERQVLWQDQAALGNWPFMLLATLLWFGLVFWALETKAGRNYFLAPHKGNK